MKMVKFAVLMVLPAFVVSGKEIKDDLSLSGETVIDVAEGATDYYTGTISGSGFIRKTGAGTLSLQPPAGWTNLRRRRFAGVQQVVCRAFLGNGMSAGEESGNGHAVPLRKGERAV